MTRALVVRLDSDGDVLLAGPAVRAVAAGSDHVVLLVSPAGEQAARSLGASALQTFRRITLPSIKWAVVYGVVLSLARSLGEFGAVKVVSGNVERQTQTATLVVEQKYQNFEQATAYSTAFMLAAAAVICLIVVTIIRPSQEHS